MNEPELEKQLKELKIELIKANSQVASGSAPKNPGQIKHTKKTIARILTIINEKKVKSVYKIFFSFCVSFVCILFVYEHTIFFPSE